MAIFRSRRFQGGITSTSGSGTAPLTLRRGYFAAGIPELHVTGPEDREGIGPDKCHPSFDDDDRPSDRRRLGSRRGDETAMRVGRLDPVGATGASAGRLLLV
jgi:hypothetical protein